MVSKGIWMPPGYKVSGFRVPRQRARGRLLMYSFRYYRRSLAISPCSKRSICCRFGILLYPFFQTQLCNSVQYILRTITTGLSALACLPTAPCLAYYAFIQRRFPCSSKLRSFDRRMECLSTKMLLFEIACVICVGPIGNGH